MKNLAWALAACFVAALVSCGGGGAEGDQSTGRKPFGSDTTSGLPTFNGSGVTGLIGIVVDSSNGNPISGVTVTAGGLTATTDANGNFAMPTIPLGTSVVSFNIASHAPQSRTVVITRGIETSVIMLMTPNATTTPSTFDPTAGATVNGPLGSQVVLAPNALQRADGSPPAVGAAAVILTPLAPALDPFLEPGEFVATASAGGTTAFETFAAIDIRITDSAGVPLTNLVGGATVYIPVSSRNATLPATVSLFRFDATSGQYVEDGTAALVTLNGNRYYTGTLTRIGPWVAGQNYSAATVSVCVENQNGVRIAGARVQSDGVNYSGGGAAVTDASGVALVPMKQVGAAVITATSPRSSNSATVTNPGASFTLTPCLVMPTSGLSIRLTWGALPTDLDSHLKGPNSTHVYFASRGSLSSAPFAALDVDDVTSFGPEVITVARLPVGTSEYFVHNFSNTFSPGMTASPARVEMRYGSQIRIFSPPAGENTNLYWRVFQFTVSADCAVTFTPVQQWTAAEPADPAGTAAGSYCS